MSSLVEGRGLCGIGRSPSAMQSAPPYTPRTPAIARAGPESMRRIFACGWGERTIAAYAWASRLKSSANRPAPVSSRRSSLRRIGWPMAPESISQNLPGSFTAKGRARRTSKLVQRLHLDDRRAVVAADPQRAGARRIVEIDAADVGRARQHVFGVLAAPDVESRHAVGEHRPGPRLAVAAGHRVVGRAPRRRHLPLRDVLGPGIEHADGVALIFGKPQPALVIDATAPRAGVRSRGRVDGRSPGLGVDPDDVACREVEQIGVVLRVRVDAVGADALAAARVLESAEVLDLVGEEIETVDMAAVGVLDPHLVVGGGAFDRDMAELARVRVTPTENKEWIKNSDGGHIYRL